MASEVSASTRLSPTSTLMRERQLERAQQERMQQYRAQQQEQEQQRLRQQQEPNQPPREPVLNAQGQTTGRLLNVQA